MGIVHMEILPGLSKMLTPDNRYSTHREIRFQSGDTLGMLLSRLAHENDPLGKLWDAEAGHVEAHVHPVVNGRLVSAAAARDIVLQDDDHFKWIPVYAGG